MAFWNISVLFVLIVLVSSDVDKALFKGFPNGFYSYADRNNDNKLEASEINQIQNLAWTTIWEDLKKNVPNLEFNGIERKTFMDLLLFEMNLQGMLRIAIK